MLLGKFVRNNLGFGDDNLNSFVVGGVRGRHFCPVEMGNLAENLVESHS